MCNCGIRMMPAAQAVNFKNTIPIEEYNLATSSRAMYKTWFCKSPKKVNDALSIVKNGNEPIKVNNMDEMGNLADYHDDGKDVAYYKVDFTELFSKIIFTDAENNKKECVIITY